MHHIVGNRLVRCLRSGEGVLCSAEEVTVANVLLELQYKLLGTLMHVHLGEHLGAVVQRLDVPRAIVE